MKPRADGLSDSKKSIVVVKTVNERNYWLCRYGLLLGLRRLIICSHKCEGIEVTSESTLFPSCCRIYMKYLN